MRSAGWGVCLATDVCYLKSLTQPSSARAVFVSGSFEASRTFVVPGVCFVLPDWSWWLLSQGHQSHCESFYFPPASPSCWRNPCALPMETVCFGATQQFL